MKDICLKRFSIRYKLDRTSIVLIIIIYFCHTCSPYDPTIIMPYEKISSSELNTVGNTIQCNEVKHDIKSCAEECFEKENEKENCVGFLANENDCSLCKVLDRDGINNNLNKIVSDSQKVPEIDPNIYISMDDFNLGTGNITGKGVSGESKIISAGDLIEGKVGQAIHFHSKGRIYPRVDQPECFCSFYYCNGTMSLSFWTRSYILFGKKHIITPPSGLTVAFRTRAEGWFDAKGIFLEGFGMYAFYTLS